MNLTATQQRAVEARGDVVVLAGAGTGKTRTLVERCLDCLLNEKPPLSIEEVLVVTFTEAAASEMRQRIRDRLQEQAESSPQEARWREQLALFEHARIGTLHSFCLKLVREHFYELELDPQLAIIPEEEAQMLAQEVLAKILDKHYEGTTPVSEAVRLLVRNEFGGFDEPLQQLLLTIHRFAQALPEPSRWVQSQLDDLASPEPGHWTKLFSKFLRDWSSRWLPLLSSSPAEKKAAADCRKLLERLSSASSPELIKECLEGILAIKEQSSPPRLEPPEELFEEAAFLHSLVPNNQTPNPLQQDWEWTRNHLRTVLLIASEFSSAFAARKRELGVVDFSDLEQHSLRLLWDFAKGSPSEIAREWRKQLRFIFVDEYQDINAAQDRIIEAISRTEGNRFLVGDMKQSIYRFRLADPSVFQAYIDACRKGRGTAIALNENFRSRPELLRFINSVFSFLMNEQDGSVRYGPDDQLGYGEQGREKPGAAPLSVELRLRVRGNLQEAENDGELEMAASQIPEIEEAAKEARLLTARILQLIADKFPVWDPGAGRYRAARFSDCAILLRSPANKAESYAKEFNRANIPLEIMRGGFFEAIEISDLLSLLQVLDNPLQDIPVLTVLRSPFLGLTLDELAQVRIAQPVGAFWSALVAVTEKSPPTSLLRQKVETFLTTISKWRRLAQHSTVAECLDAILGESHYLHWLAAQSRAGQRLANVKRLLTLAERFEYTQRQGLYRFLRFIEAQKNAEGSPESPSPAPGEAVRFMSIHQSKGLEFPIVALPNLGKPFNLSDLRSQVILDKELGICSLIKPPDSNSRYPSLPFWVAANRARRDLLAEESRLLYVGMTRARDLLLLSGSVSKSRFDDLWLTPGQEQARRTEGALSYLDWLGIWFVSNVSTARQTRGEHELIHWCVHDDQALASIQAARRERIREERKLESRRPHVPAETDRGSQLYPYSQAAKLPAKTAVSTIRRTSLATEKETLDLAVFRQPVSRNRSAKPGGIDVGIAHHTFLEHVSLSKTVDSGSFRSEILRLVSSSFLTAEQAAVLDVQALTAFWTSEVGARIRENAANVHRELPFTFRMQAARIARLLNQSETETLAADFVVVQGVADLVVTLARELWILDFKTDQIQRNTDLLSAVARYRPQLTIYAEALGRIYKRPVKHAWLHFLAAGKTIELPRAGVGAQNQRTAPNLLFSL